MKNQSFAQFFAIIVGLGGVAMFAAWIVKLDSLFRLNGEYFLPKPLVAFLFIFAGAQLYAMAARFDERRNYTFFVTFIALFITFMVGSQVFTLLSGTPTGIDLLFPGANENPRLNTPRATASVATIVCFLSLATIGLLDNVDKHYLIRKALNVMIFFVSTTALFGYVFNYDPLRFDVPGFSNQIAIYTAVFALLMSVSVYFSAAKESNNA